MTTQTKLPYRNKALADTQQGLFKKFDIQRDDGQDLPGGKHYGCEYFVLDLTHDPYALPALAAYAEACSGTHPYLAKDLQEKWKLPKSDGSVLLKHAKNLSIALDNYPNGE